MSAVPTDTHGAAPSGSAGAENDDVRRMAPVYLAVIVVEVVVLLGLWAFQTYFSS